MTSVKCFINWMKEAGRGHLAAFAGWGVMAAYGLLMILRLSFDTEYTYFGLGNPALARLCAGMGFLIAFLEFFYLFQQKKQDFYYSLPVKKGTIFWSRYVHGAIHFIIPAGLALSACGIYQAATDTEFALFVGSYTGKSFLCAAGVFLIFYHIGILCITVCGNLLSALVLCAAFVLYFRILVGNVLTAFASAYFQTYYRIPAYEKLSELLVPSALSENLFGSNVYEKADALSFTPSWDLCAAAFMWIAVLFLLIVAAQCRRKTERTGQVFVLPLAERATEFLFSFLAGTGAAALLAGVTDLVQENRAAGVLLLAAVSLIVAGAVHCVMESIVKRPGTRSMRSVFLRRKGQFAAVCIAAVAAGAVFPFSASFHDSYFPDEASEVSVSIAGLGMSYDIYLQVQGDGENYETEDQLEKYTMTGEGKSAALGWLEEIARGMRNQETGNQDEGNRETGNSGEGNQVCTRATVRYRAGSREIYRSYPVTGEALESFAAVYETDEYKEKAYPGVNLADVSEDRFTWNDGVKAEDLKLAEDEKEGLIAAYREDVSDLEMAQLRTALPSGYVKVKGAMSGSTTELIVYPFFRRTCAVLEESGINTQKTFLDYQVESVEVRETLFSAPSGSSGGVSMSFYEEPEEVEEWKEKLVPSDLDVQPLLYPLDHSKEIRAVTKDPETNSLIQTNCVLK